MILSQGAHGPKRRSKLRRLNWTADWSYKTRQRNRQESTETQNWNTNWTNQEMGNRCQDRELIVWEKHWETGQADEVMWSRCGVFKLEIPVFVWFVFNQTLTTITITCYSTCRHISFYRSASVAIFNLLATNVVEVSKLHVSSQQFISNDEHCWYALLYKERVIIRWFWKKKQIICWCICSCETLAVQCLMLRGCTPCCREKLYITV